MKDMPAVTPRRALMRWSALAVAACGVAVTAHGLYAVAVASGVPWQVAVLYPVIADGLALVAYSATRRLRSALYPWAVVVVAAGLSGMAQGVHLAEGAVPWSAEWWLRFGIGAGAAVAVLAAAHLVWLVDRPRAEAISPASPDADVRTAGSNASSIPPEQPAGQVPSMPPNPDPPAPPVNGNGNGHGATLKAQAEREALAYLAEHGALPSENVLAGLAGCSRGTARNALIPMRKG